MGNQNTGSTRLERMRHSNQEWARKAAREDRRHRVNPAHSSWKRETHTLPRMQAREKAKAFLKKYPKAAYWSEVESWRVLDGDMIEFTMRRLPTAD